MVLLRLEHPLEDVQHLRHRGLVAELEKARSLVKSSLVFLSFMNILVLELERFGTSTYVGRMNKI